jgi:acetyl esterase/lipase
LRAGARGSPASPRCDARNCRHARTGGCYYETPLSHHKKTVLTCWRARNPRNPETYACGIDIVGPSNLETLIATIPPYWEAIRTQLTKAVGDPETEEGLALMRDRSPLYRVDRIKRPLLIAQGANDPRVKRAESDQMVGALRASAIPVTYVLYPDEGHGFARPENSISFNAITEAFLARHLGGRVEPITAEEIAASSMQVLEGAAELNLPRSQIET